MTVEEAFQLLRGLGASPALVRRHELVVETANAVLAGVMGRHPELSVDVDRVLCGAALHDAGRIRVPAGGASGAVGEAMLLTAGVDPAIAACCVARSQLSEEASLEVLLVALAAALWKGERDKLLEQLFADRVAAQSRADPQRVWVQVDELLEAVARDGPRRLAWSQR